MSNITERALWTTLQAFLAVVLASGADWVNVGTLKAAGVAAVAAGLSVVKTYAQTKLGSAA